MKNVKGYMMWQVSRYKNGHHWEAREVVREGKNALLSTLNEKSGFLLKDYAPEEKDGDGDTKCIHYREMHLGRLVFINGSRIMIEGFVDEANDMRDLPTLSTKAKPAQWVLETWILYS